MAETTRKTNAPPQTSVNRPQNFLAIPGVNEFLPLSVAPEIVAGLLIGLVVHEGGHGLLCRVEDIEIESMGLALLAIIPVGAFVEPDQESQQNASRGGRTRMFAAGVTNNFAITIVAYAILFGPVIASIGVAPGAAVGGVIPGSTAADAGIDAGDRITGIDGTAVANNSDLQRELDEAEGDTVTLEVNGQETRTVERSVLVVGVVRGGPANLSQQDRIAAVNGTSVSTRADFLAAMEQREVATVTTANGSTARFPVGTFVSVSEDGPLDRSTNLSPGQTLVVQRIAGERTVTDADLGEALDAVDPGEEIEVVAYVNGTKQSFDVTVGEADDGNGYLGVFVYRGVSGVAVDDFGIQAYPADEFLGVLGKGDGGGGFFGTILVSLFLPFADVMPLLPFSTRFFGFAGFNLNFFQPTGPLGFLGQHVFLVANVLFWTGWINVQLGFFNCIPAFPLDGGHILRTSTEAVLSRLPIDTTRQMIRTITTTVGVTMLLSFLVMVFAPSLL